MIDDIKWSAKNDGILSANLDGVSSTNNMVLTPDTTMSCNWKQL